MPRTIKQAEAEVAFLKSELEATHKNVTRLATESANLRSEAGTKSMENTRLRDEKRARVAKGLRTYAALARKSQESIESGKGVGTIMTGITADLLAEAAEMIAPTANPNPSGWSVVWRGGDGNRVASPSTAVVASAEYTRKES